MPARAAVEALLRERKLDRTLTSALPERLRDDAVAVSGIAVPRGHVSEVVGPASSGRTSIAWAAMAAATNRGESVALIDTFDRFDPPTADAGGIELSKLLWVRGQAVSGPGTFMERVIDRAIKALNLVVQSRVCTVVVIDLIDVPAVALRRLPASTWFRIERAIEGSDSAVLILAAVPVARSAGGRSIAMQAGNRFPDPGGVVWKGDHDRNRRIAGVRGRASVGAARWSHTPSVDIETSIRNAV